MPRIFDVCDLSSFGERSGFTEAVAFPAVEGRRPLALIVSPISREIAVDEDGLFGLNRTSLENTGLYGNIIS